MKAAQRREHILGMIQKDHSVANEELQRIFGVTKETIRKDLNVLSEKGHIIRTFGGAIARDEYDPSIEQRTVSNYDEKQLIAEAAIKFVKANDVIAIDSGSTTLELANLLTGENEMVVLTNSLKILNALAKKSSVTVIGTGGILRARSMSFQGAAAEATIRSYNIMKAFISAKALDLEKGIMDSNESEASVKRAILDSAQDVTLLVDHTKFTRMAHITVCPVNRVNRIITSTLVSETDVKEYRKAGIDIIQVC